MVVTGLDTFDTTVKKSNEWLKEIMQDQEWEGRHKAYLALRSVLHALRDRLIVDEAVHLGAQLPMLIRGLYYEGWTPSGKPIKRSREEFLTAISEGFQNDPAIDPERVVRSVFAVMAKRVSEGEIEDIKSALPEEIRELWPQ